MARVHDYHETAQGVALSQVGAAGLPLCAQPCGTRAYHTREVHQSPRFADRVEIDGLGAPGRSWLVRASPLRPVSGVDRADLPTFERPRTRSPPRPRSEIGSARRGQHKLRCGEGVHRCRNGGNLINRAFGYGERECVRSRLLRFCRCVLCAASAQDSAKGESIAKQVCAALPCWRRQQYRPANPKIRRQIAEYLHKQLQDFKPQSGKKPARESAVMTGMVANLSEADMKGLAAYYAGQKLRPAAAADKELAQLGQKLWRGGNLATGVPACAGCHGPTGAGIPSQYPRLSGHFGNTSGPAQGLPEGRPPTTPTP